MKRVKTSAVVTLTVEVPVCSSWGGDCPLEQVHRQAASEAVATLSTVLREKKITHSPIRVDHVLSTTTEE